jgi:uncharacterized protein (DUF427 family)
MGLTYGDDPFGPEASGRFSFDPPDQVVFARPLGRRVRATVGSVTLIDTDDARLLWETGRLPRYAFPVGDVDLPGVPAPLLDGYVTVDWDAADAWYEEDERVFVHPRDPFHRIETFRTSRRVRVTAGGAVLAESTRTRALHETGLPVRHYFPSADVRLDLLEPSPTVTECPYKGTASYLRASVDGQQVDVAWTYTGELRREGEPVRDLIAFLDDVVDVHVVDGAATRSDGDT